MRSSKGIVVIQNLDGVSQASQLLTAHLYVLVVQLLLASAVLVEVREELRECNKMDGWSAEAVHAVLGHADEVILDQWCGSS